MSENDTTDNRPEIIKSLESALRAQGIDVEFINLSEMFNSTEDQVKESEDQTEDHTEDQTNQPHIYDVDDVDHLGTANFMLGKVHEEFVNGVVTDFAPDTKNQQAALLASISHALIELVTTTRRMAETMDQIGLLLSKDKGND